MAKKLSKYVFALRNKALLDAWDGELGAFGIVPQHRHLTTPVFAAATFVQNTSYPFYVIPGTSSAVWRIVGIAYRFTTQATGAATFKVEVAGAGIAPGSGTAQTGSMTLQGTANTTINGTVTTQTDITAGTAINLLVTNDAATTGLVGLTVTIALARVS